MHDPEREPQLPARLVRLAPLALILSLALHALAVAHWTRGLTALYDLEVYRAGGRAIVDGTSLYDRDVFWVLKFTYPPFAAVVFTPLALVPVWLLKLAFSAVNVAALGAVIWLCLRALGYAGEKNLRAAVILLTALLFWLEPVRSTIDIGQVNLLLMLLVVWDLISGPRRYQGIGVGIAAGIKLVPGIFILYLLLTRRWRAAGVALAAFAGTVAVAFVVAPGQSARYWGGTFLATGRIGRTEETGNQSLSGLVARLGGSSAVWVLLAVVVGVAGLAVSVRAHRRGEELLAVTLCGLTACAVSPFSWNHHWVWFVPLLLVLGARRLTVVLFLLLVDWPVVFSPGDGIFPPPTGLISVPDGGVLAFVTRNLYVLVTLALGAWLSRGQVRFGNYVGDRS
jgi:alpha-1,2-mannosyltransferase